MNSRKRQTAAATVGPKAMAPPAHWAGVRLGLATAEAIRGASHGEVRKARTVEFDTLRPVPDGLFCEKIFGPTRDYECRCGRCKGIQLKGMVCPRCRVEITRAAVRRERMGHVALAAPVANPWFSAGRPSILGILLDLPTRSVADVTYFARTIARPYGASAKASLLDHLRAYPNEASLGRQRIREIDDRLWQDEVLALTERELDAIDPERQWLDAGTGADAIRKVLIDLDLRKLSERLLGRLRSQSGDVYDQTRRRVTLVDALRASGNDPASMILTVLPVLPPDLRPIVRSKRRRGLRSANPVAGSDLNRLYMSVIQRNTRLRDWQAREAPEIILRSEKRLLQAAVDSLILSGSREHAYRRSESHDLKSLSDGLKGKQGRLRRNLLGKRVDYAGRAVIIVGPELKLHQCGLPRRMALELFKPFVVHGLVEKGLAASARSAKRMVERARPEVWGVLEGVVRTRPVLLNRAPTLHRLGIQAFEPVLIEGSAIRIHPLACAGFNADFDGDQMAVHVPLSREAVAEARRVMLSTHNLRSPGSGELIVSPTLDIVLGCYYLTIDKFTGPGACADEKKAQQAAGVYGTAAEALLAHHLGKVDLQARIRVRVPYARLEAPSAPGERRRSEIMDTTVGRLIFNEVLPPGVAAAMTGGIDFINETLDRNLLKNVVVRCHELVGDEETAEVVDNIKRIGFDYATRSGMTIAVNDLRVPEEKDVLIRKAEDRIREIDGEFEMGLITEQERHDATVEVWNGTTEDVKKTIHEQLDRYGFLGSMVGSGAKGNISQITQMAGMRGLMVDPSGRTIDLPIRSNFREGLTVLEYFISTHGARKGLADRALRTADSGYLTRRLIEVAQDVIVLEEDCGTPMGVWLDRPDAGALESFSQRIVGRYSASDLADPQTGEMLCALNKEIDEVTAARIGALGLERVHVRSPLTCEAKRGLCRRCYGRSPATGSLVEIGQAVGIIAAQAIGEPGSQLTMRTFHTGGVAGGADMPSGLSRVEELFEARAPKVQALIADIDGVAEILRGDGRARGRRRPGQVVVGSRDKVAVTNEDGAKREYAVPAALQLCIQNGEQVRIGRQLTDGLPNPRDILRILGPEALQRYLVEEVQNAYRSQGVTIHDKHIEVIVRQMLRHVSVDQPGDTGLLPHTIVDRVELAAVNSAATAHGGAPATPTPVLLGITQAALRTGSFLAAASFREATRVLAEAAISGKTDSLDGLAENVMTGRLIPAQARIDLPERAGRDRASVVGETASRLVGENPSPPDLANAAVEVSDQAGPDGDEDEDQDEPELPEPTLQAIEQDDLFDEV